MSRQGAAPLLAVLLLAGTLQPARCLKGQYIEDADRFPGWRGELPHMEAAVGDTVGFGELGQVLPPERARLPAHAACRGRALLSRTRMRRRLLACACKCCGCRSVALPRPPVSSPTFPHLPCAPQTLPRAQELWRGKVEQVSWKPRAFLYHNFLTDEECEHLKNLARSRLVKSTVVDNDSGKSVDSRVRAGWRFCWRVGMRWSESVDEGHALEAARQHRHAWVL